MSISRYSQLNNRGRKAEPKSDINVTPFVDVMLVLLIIFMISAPLLVHGVNVNLPQNSSAPAINNTDPFTLTVNEEGGIFYKKQEVKLEQVRDFLHDNALSLNTKIYIRGDKEISYGRVMKLIAEINKAGYMKVALVTYKKH